VGPLRRRFVRPGRPPPSDALLALVFVVVGQVDVWSPWGDEFPRDGFDGPPAVNAALVLLYTAPVAWRRRAPTPALALMVAAALVQLVFVSPTVLFFGGLLPTVVMAYSVALYERPGRDFLGLGIGVVGLAVAAAATARVSDASDWAFDLLLLSVAWGMGRLIRSRQSETARAERQRDERGLAAAAEERARIARELHDLVAHGVSVMGIQAAAAQVLIDRDPAAARAAMLAVERMSRDALSEMHHLVGVLRDDPDGAALAPQPRLGDLAALLTDVRGAGLPVELVIEGERRDLAAGLELSAYRIVQEALTNSLKHAGPATATVRVRYAAHDLELRIADTGTADTAPATAGGGRGIPGMRERVGLYGGELRAGRGNDGYLVQARFPLARP
jgi:signal transduction histidine kinase